MSEINVRPAKPTELRIVQDMNHALFISDAEHFDDLHVEWPYEEVGERYFRDRIAGKGGVCYVAEIEGRIVGYVAAGWWEAPAGAYKGKRVELENMYVNDDVRRQGVGSKLVDTLFDWAREQAADYVMVNAYSPNTRAIAFYEHKGFTPYAVDLWAKL